MTRILEAIRTILDERGVPFRELQHTATKTSAESAAVRGEPLEIGGKAILLKIDDGFALFVLPANCKLNSGAIRKQLGVRKTRFATAEELAEQTGLVPGSVPPFGRPVLPFDLYVDTGVQANERIAFNAGSLTNSVIMSTDDYFSLAQPVKVFSFAVEAE